MTTSQIDALSPRRPLRLWPGVVIVILQLVGRFVVPVFFPDFMIYGVLGGVAGALLVVLWWLFLSRAAWSERLGAVVLMVAALYGTSCIVDKSIATGAMGMLFPILAIPGLGPPFVAWAVATRRVADGPRRATMVATILLACGVWALVRTGGFTAGFHNDLAWRWAKTPEERLLAQAGEEPAAPPAAPPTTLAPQEKLAAPAGKPAALPSAPAAAVTHKEPVAATAGAPPAALPAAPTEASARADWPGFRGPNRDGIVTGVQIRTDWSASPPVELWRQPIGPGWSSFAVRGDRLYTQEQRGDQEVVACYDATTGKPVWRHRDPARFWESNAGAGPRATPTLSGGRVYTLGGTGIVNVLVAYDLVSGDRRWLGPKGREGYSSPQLVTIDGVPQILQLSGTGLVSVAPADGKLLWQHEWQGYPIVQPAQTADGDVLIAVSDSSGTRRLALAHGPDGWTSKERWTSNGLKPYFNDFVVHKGHAFGFDGSILACIDLEDGSRKWKGGRYGNGQLVLLPEQDLLLVLSEEGELALVKATPDQFTELARFPALEGKTWNHPVLVGDRLLVRNGEHMEAFRLPVAGR